MFANKNNKISVIVAVYNGNSKHYNIKRTLDSVLSQTYKNFEIIVIDGGSTDGTVEIIKNYAKKGKIAYFVSEKDKGIYDAMNKGIKASKGEWLYFLNSDDCLFGNKVFSKVAKEFDENIDLVCGAIAFNNKEGKLQKTFTPFSKFGLKIGKAPPHQGAFFRKKCFVKMRYSLEYKICSDYDFFCYCAEEDFKAKNNSYLIMSRFSLDGKGSNSGAKEVDKIILNRYGLFYIFLKNFVFLFYKLKGMIICFLFYLFGFKSRNVLFKHSL